MKRATALLALCMFVAVAATACKKKDTNKKPAATPPAPTTTPAKNPVVQPDTVAKPNPAAMAATFSMIVKHEVADWDKWKKAYDAHADARKAMGTVWSSVSRSVDNDNVVIIHFAGPDMKKLQDFAASDELKKAMKEAGVKGEPEISFLKDVKINAPKAMPKGDTWSIYVTHEVTDYDKWLPGFDAHDKARVEAGQLGYGVSQAPDNKNMVTVHMIFDNIEKPTALFKSEDTMKLMKEAGVKGKPTIWVAKDVGVRPPAK